MKNISVLIKPASGACNMTCDYCFYCDEAAKREQKFYGMMSEETLKNMIRRTMLHSEGSVSYTWQGGEPTLRGLDFFRKALYLQKKYNRNQVITLKIVYFHLLLVIIIINTLMNIIILVLKSLKKI